MDVLAIKQQGRVERTEEANIRCVVYVRAKLLWYCPDPEDEEDCQVREDKLRDGVYDESVERWITREEYEEYSFRVQAIQRVFL